MYTVELLNGRHLADVSAIEQECFSDAWSINALKSSLEDENYRFYCLAEKCVTPVLSAPEETSEADFSAVKEAETIMPSEVRNEAEEAKNTVEEHIAGYVILLEVCGEGEIVRVAIDRAYRKRGLGDVLLKEVLRAEKMRNTERLYLEVRESNEAAIRLYRKNGFTVDGKRKNFYTKPIEDALLMSRGL